MKNIALIITLIFAFALNMDAQHKVKDVYGTKYPGYIIEATSNAHIYRAPESSFIDFGQDTSTTDASGDVTITHDLADTTYYVQATTADSVFHVLGVHSKNDSTFSIRVYDNSGIAETTTSIIIDWIARKDY